MSNLSDLFSLFYQGLVVVVVLSVGLRMLSFMLDAAVGSSTGFSQQKPEPKPEPDVFWPLLLRFFSFCWRCVVRLMAFLFKAAIQPEPREPTAYMGKTVVLDDTNPEYDIYTGEKLR